jgi:hypothetical protein
VTSELFIDGTQMTFDEYGLPDSMTGDLYFGDDARGAPVGRYEETLDPVFMGGQFAGTTGVGTFTFFVAASPSRVVETITTANTSFIRGVVPETGGLIVSSTGEITASSGLFKNLQGGFTSSSVVVMGPQFDADTQVDFTVGFSSGKANGGAFKALQQALHGFSHGNSQGGGTGFHGWSDAAPSSDHSAGQGVGPGQHAQTDETPAGHDGWSSGASADADAGGSVGDPLGDLTDWLQSGL